MGIKSGEFFDLTTTSYNNEYGKLKNDNAKAHGISSTLDKYIEELEMITKGAVKDDKYEKRMKRLEFLILCNGCPGLRSYFEGMNTYINGKEIQFLKYGTFEQYDGKSNPLILICAGGNIITIFAKLLLIDIDNYKTDPKKALSRFFPSYLDEGGKECLINFLTKGTFQKSVQELASKDFSDFDYNLLPNKEGLKHKKSAHSMEIDHHPEKEGVFTQEKEGFTQEEEGFTQVEVYNTDDVFIEHSSLIQLKPMSAGSLGKRIRTASKRATDNQTWMAQEADNKANAKKQKTSKPPIKYAVKEKKDMTGFVLFRVKTLFYNKEYVDPMPNTCDTVKLPSNVKKNLFPQMVQDSWTKDEWWKNLFIKPAENSPTTSSCLSFILNLIKKKRDIEKSTKNNIYGTIETYKNKPNVIFKDDLNSIIEYLHNTTKNLNAFIERWFKDWFKTNRAIKDNWVDDNFSTLNKIVTCNNGLLIKLNRDIINYFLNKDIINYSLNKDNQGNFYCDEIIQTILKKENEFNDHPNKIYTASPPKLLVVPFSKLRKELVKGVEEISWYNLPQGVKGVEEISWYNLPQGVNVTINAIETDKLDSGSNVIVTLDDGNNAAKVEHVADLNEPETGKIDVLVLNDDTANGESDKIGGRKSQKTKKYKRKYKKSIKKTKKYKKNKKV